MNIGSGKYHPGGTSCTYKGEIVPCLVRFSEGGIISGNILTNILRHLDYFKLHENDRKTSIVPTLLVDGHCSRFDILKKNTYVMKITNRSLFLVFCMGHHCGR